MLFGIFMILPLAVLYTIRFTELQWWWALILVFFGQGIPLIGQIGTFAAAILGAYHFVAEDFNWRQVAYPEEHPIETYNISELSEEEFERYKTERVIPEIENSCKISAKAQFGFDNRISENIAAYCECFAERLGGSLSKSDAIEAEERGNMEHIINDRGRRIHRECRNQIRTKSS